VSQRYRVVYNLKMLLCVDDGYIRVSDKILSVIVIRYDGK